MHDGKCDIGINAFGCEEQSACVDGTIKPIVAKHREARTNYCFLILATRVKLKELASPQREDHTLVVLL